MVLTQWETLCGLFFAFFEKIVVPILTSGGLVAQRHRPLEAKKPYPAVHLPHGLV